VAASTAAAVEPRRSAATSWPAVTATLRATPHSSRSRVMAIHTAAPTASPVAPRGWSPTKATPATPMTAMTATWTAVGRSTNRSLMATAVATAYAASAGVTAPDVPRSPGVGGVVSAVAATTAMTAQPSGLSSSRWWRSR
jgi:hypothetical protein